MDDVTKRTLETLAERQAAVEAEHVDLTPQHHIADVARQVPALAKRVERLEPLFTSMGVQEMRIASCEHLDGDSDLVTAIKGLARHVEACEQRLSDHLSTPAEPPPAQEKPKHTAQQTDDRHKALWGFSLHKPAQTEGHMPGCQCNECYSAEVCAKAAPQQPPEPEYPEDRPNICPGCGAVKGVHACVCGDPQWQKPPEHASDTTYTPPKERLVRTSQMEGVLEMRYAPREPEPRETSTMPEPASETYTQPPSVLCASQGDITALSSQVGAFVFDHIMPKLDALAAKVDALPDMQEISSVIIDQERNVLTAFKEIAAKVDALQKTVEESNYCIGQFLGKLHDEIKLLIPIKQEPSSGMAPSEHPFLDFLRAREAKLPEQPNRPMEEKSNG